MQVSARTLFAMFSVLIGLAACGGSDPQSNSCTSGQMSVPGGPGDPCQQDNPQCLALQGKGVAICSGGAWGQCVCMAPQSQSTPPTAGGAATTCGDNVVQPTETCERGQIPGAMTCEAMYGKGATGLVMCTQCKIDFSMCVPPKMMGTGGSGAMVVGGSGAIVGTGGTGR